MAENGEPPPRSDAIICHEIGAPASHRDPEPRMSIELATETQPTVVAPGRPRARRTKPSPEAATPTYYDVVPSPIGDLYITARDGAITGLHMGEPRGGDETVGSWSREPRMLAAARAQ